MEPGTGRHRKRSARGAVIAVGVFLALGAAFVGGMITDRSLGGGTAGRTPAAAPTSPAPASVTVPGSSSPDDRPPAATVTPAHPDPDAPGPQGSAAYLARLQDDGLPVPEHRDVVLVLGRIVCQAPPPERADTAAMATRVSAVAGDLLSPPQTLQLVQVAAQELCGP
jgi:hypothetical protein